MITHEHPDEIRPFSVIPAISMPLGLDTSVPISAHKLVDGTLAYTVSYDHPQYPYHARLLVRRNTVLNTVERVIRVERPEQNAAEAMLLRVSPALSMEYGIHENGTMSPLVEVSRFRDNMLFSFSNSASLRLIGGQVILHTGAEETSVQPGDGWIKAGDRLVKIFMRDKTFAVSYAFDDNPHEEAVFVDNGELRYRNILKAFFDEYQLPDHIVVQSYASPYFFVHAVLEVFAQEDPSMYFSNIMREIQQLYFMKTAFSPLIAEVQGNIPEVSDVLHARQRLANTAIPSRSAITGLVNLFDPSIVIRSALNIEVDEIMKFRRTQNPPGAKR